PLAGGVLDRAVHLHKVTTAGLGVQTVDVLGDHRAHPAGLLEPGQRPMRAVGLLVLERLKTVAVEAPEAFRVAPEHVDVRPTHRIHPRPQSGPWRPEV